MRQDSVANVMTRERLLRYVEILATNRKLDTFQTVEVLCGMISLTLIFLSYFAPLSGLEEKTQR